jgi:Fe-S-cluster containining protein
LVEVGADEVIARTHAQLLVVDEHGRHLPRPGGSCPLLDGGTGTPWRCREYSDRPRSCRDFEIGGAACLEARRRVGLSP